MKTTIQINAIRQLDEAIEAYMREVMCEGSVDMVERMTAGVKAFMWVNYYKDFYLPLDIYQTENKRWWEFWK